MIIPKSLSSAASSPGVSLELELTATLSLTHSLSWALHVCSPTNLPGVHRVCKAVGLVKSDQTTTPEEERWYDDGALLVQILVGYFRVPLCWYM